MTCTCVHLSTYGNIVSFQRESWKYIPLNFANPCFLAPFCPCSARVPFFFTSSSILIFFIEIKTSNCFSLLPLPHISFPNSPQYNNAVFLPVNVFILRPASLLPSSPIIILYLITILPQPTWL